MRRAMTLSSQNSGYAEKRLLVACARMNMAPGEVETLRELASKPLDWDFIISAAAENSEMPLLSRQLSAYAADLAPAASLERIKGAARANTLKCLALTGELLRILGEFQRQGVVAIPYKGPVVAAQAYGDVALREYEDLDVILRQKDLKRADEVMRGLGYAARYPWIHSREVAGSLVPGEYNYREEARGIIVELHTELTMRHFPARIDLDALSLRLTTVALSGHEVKTFSPEDALPILCVHGAKDYWERIIWVADVAELAQRGSGCDWENVFRRAEELGAGRMLRVGLALAAELLGAPFPPGVAARVSRDDAAIAIANERAAQLLDREPRRMGGRAIFKYRRQMVSGGFAGWKYAWRLALEPAEEDWKETRPPRALAPMRGALRPFRLLKKYGWGGGHERRDSN